MRDEYCMDSWDESAAQDARTLLQHWLVILQQVLSELGYAYDLTYLQRHSRLAFYGDLLTRQHLENTLNASTLMPQHWSPFSFL